MDIQLNNRTVSIPDSWDEIKLDKYLKFDAKIAEVKGDNPYQARLITFELIQIIADLTEEELDELTPEETNLLATPIKVLSDKRANPLSNEVKKTFEINGNVYMAIDPKSMTNAEVITADMLQEQYGNSVMELIPRLLAILIRPQEREYNEEKKEWEEFPRKFNKKDYEDLEWRANLFLNEANALDVLPIVNFFLNISNG